MQKFKEKERNSIVNARNDDNKDDEYRCVVRSSLGGLIRSAPTFIQIAGRCRILCTFACVYSRTRIHAHNNKINKIKYRIIAMAITCCRACPYIQRIS